MTIVFGVLSVLAGIFVFRQGTVLSVLSSITDSNSASATSGAFLIVAICLIVAGICGCICKNGNNKGATVCAAVFYLLGAVFAFIFKTGDLKLWAVVCAVMAAVYLFLQNKTKSSKTSDASENSGDAESEPNEDVQKALKAKEELYQKCVKAFNAADELEDLITIKKAFESLGDYKDAHSYISQLDYFINLRKNENQI